MAKSEQELLIQEQATEIEKLNMEKAALKEENKALKKANDELKKLAANQIPQKNIKGFVLEADDPFGEGTLQDYLRTTQKKQIQAPRLPFVLPEDDPATEHALERYILRASGGCDNKRAEAAKTYSRKIFGDKKPEN